MTVSVTQEQMRQNVFHHTLTVPMSPLTVPSSPSPGLPLSLKGQEKNPRQHPALYSKITYRHLGIVYLNQKGKERKARL